MYKPIKFRRSYFKRKIEITFKKSWNSWELLVQLFDREVQFSNAYLGFFEATVFAELHSWHYAWWRFSFIYALRDGIETVTICGECDAREELGTARDPFSGDRLSYCPDCRSVEGETREITVRQYEARS